MNNSSSAVDHRKIISKKSLIFIIIEFFLYAAFLYIDILNTNLNLSKNSVYDFFMTSSFLSSDHLKYYSILICLCAAIISLCKEKTKAAVLLVCALSFTVISDFFLLLNPDHILPGIGSFCIVHFIYLLVINNGSFKKSIAPAGIRIAVSMILTIIILKTGIVSVSKASADKAIIFLALLYGVSFAGNIIRLSISKEKCAFAHSSLFQLGLIIFLLCDINVLIFNFDSFINIHSSTYNFLKNLSEVLMWAFYLPSQVLIVLSAI